jgi:hypothetical protein
LGLVVVVAALVLVHSWARTTLLTLLAGFLFLVTLWPFYFPIRYLLSDQGVAVDYGFWRHRWPWERFRVYVPLEEAFLLSPFVQAHRLERYRSLQLPCPGHEAAVERVLADHLRPRETGKEPA